jgi:hypothetical protein
VEQRLRIDEVDVVGRVDWLCAGGFWANASESIGESGAVETTATTAQSQPSLTRPLIPGEGFRAFVAVTSVATCTDSDYGNQDAFALNWWV